MVLSLALAGCSTTSGVLPLGSDSYLLSVRTDEMERGASDAHVDVLVKANQYCAKLGSRILVTNRFDIVLPTEMTPGNASDVRTVNVTFRCLAPLDPELPPPSISAVSR